MGNTIFIKDRKVCVKPLGSRIEAILKLEPPQMPKGCRSFAGMVNFLSMFCLELQQLLKPIYDLTRKGRPFIWGKEQQELLEEIKKRLAWAPVLHVPNRQGRFHLYSDTSKFAAGSALYQIQNCYVRQYALYGMSRGKFTAYIYMCSLCTAIHNYSSSGSLFFATLRWNN